MDWITNAFLYFGQISLSGALLVFIVFIVPYLLFCLGRWLDDEYNYGTVQQIILWVCYLVLFVLSVSWMIWVWPTPVVQMPRGKLESFAKFQASRKVVEPTQIELGTEIKRYILVSYRPPKHFYVTLKDTKTNEVLENVYVSKHCNSASQLKAGEEYNIPLRKYAWSNSPNIVRYEFKGLYGVFCE